MQYIRSHWDLLKIVLGNDEDEYIQAVENAVWRVVVVDGDYYYFNSDTWETYKTTAFGFARH